jgi:RIO kinase 1
MDTNNYIEFFNELDDNEQTNNFVQSDKRRERFPARNPKKVPDADREFLAKQDDSRGNFKFTYKAARFEEWWLLDSLGSFYEHKWISDVLKRIKGGKEASVYQCRPGVAVDASLVAAKVYRPRSLRNLKNDAQYRAGRADLDEQGNAIVKAGDVHAMQKRTNYGEGLRHQSWIAYEFKTLELLHTAGVDVPRPYAMEPNAILMGFVGDQAAAAAALSSITLELHEAKSLFERVIHNIDLMLAHGRIHGDLSAYNILYWQGDITLIDFPQVVLPESNPASWTIFLRDVTRICQYFASQGLPRDERALATQLWTSHGYKTHAEVDPKYLDPDRAEDRRSWENQK